jgi:hypothetical protein
VCRQAPALCDGRRQATSRRQVNHRADGRGPARTRSGLHIVLRLEGNYQQQQSGFGSAELLPMRQGRMDRRFASPISTIEEFSLRGVRDKTCFPKTVRDAELVKYAEECRWWRAAGADRELEIRGLQVRRRMSLVWSVGQSRKGAIHPDSSFRGSWWFACHCWFVCEQLAVGPIAPTFRDGRTFDDFIAAFTTRRVDTMMHPSMVLMLTISPTEPSEVEPTDRRSLRLVSKLALVCQVRHKGKHTSVQS